MRNLLLCLCFAFSLSAEEKVTTHSLELETGLLNYTAKVDSLPVKDKEGNEKGQISYIAYTQEDSKRPITFVFNGGPGSSSVWLHLGAFGPRRVISPEEGQSVVPPYQIVDNTESILDLTDLVFVDPIGTGFSRAKTAEDAKAYYDTKGDIESIGDFIRDFLTAHGRWNSPLYIAGESYGTCRSCGLAHYLQTEHGIYPNGLILISCAMDYQLLFSSDSNNFLPCFLHFPTYATTAWYHGRLWPEKTLEEVVSAARIFAYETYAPFLLRSHLSSADKEVFFEQIASMTGLPLTAVKREQGKIQDTQFLVEFFPEEKKAVGHFDTRCIGNYTHPYLTVYPQDPSATSIMGIFSTAFHKYLQSELECSSSYKIFCEEANRLWNFYSYNPFGSPNFMEALRCALVANPKLKIFAGSGYFDAVTPFAATEYCLDHLDLPDSYRENIQSEYYEGGHMYYLNPSARKKFKADLIQFFKGE